MKKATIVCNSSDLRVVVEEAGGEGGGEERRRRRMKEKKKENEFLVQIRIMKQSILSMLSFHCFVIAFHCNMLKVVASISQLLTLGVIFVKC